MLPMISHLGAMISVVNGALMAHRFQGKTGNLGAASLGDGATSTGAFHEALNQAAVEKLPLLLVVTNNQYAYSTPNERQFACADLVDKATGYGVTGHTVDGTELAECLEVIGGAAQRARSGEGPQLVVASNLRLSGHGEHDDSHYVSQHFKEMSLGRDCLEVAQDHLLRSGWADVTTLEAWAKDCAAQVEEAVAHSLREAAPDPSHEEWCALSHRHLTDGHTPSN
jgi:pyruvate dehydrogenase E1 component alpha subunit/2-oxoisovalerate dehydrogenase E1 component alpha subunit